MWPGTIKNALATRAQFLRPLLVFFFSFLFPLTGSFRELEALLPTLGNTSHPLLWQGGGCECITPQQASAQSCPQPKVLVQRAAWLLESAAWTKAAGVSGTWQCVAPAVAGCNGAAGCKGSGLQWVAHAALAMVCTITAWSRNQSLLVSVSQLPFLNN
jgi:hypothetical protein